MERQDGSTGVKGAGSEGATRRLARRRFLVLAAGGLAAAACGAPRGAGSPRAKAEPSPTPGPASRGAAVGGGTTVGGLTGLGMAPVARVEGQVEGPPIPAARSAGFAHRPLPPERLLIPNIELDTKVIPLGTTFDKQGKLAWETAAFAVGHHKDSGLPGREGNVVLSGHISSPREGGVFKDLPKVKPGDGVVLQTSERQHLYRVTETKVVLPSAVEFIDATPTPTATLITCVPDGVYSHRLIVRCEAV